MLEWEKFLSLPFEEPLLSGDYSDANVPLEFRDALSQCENTLGVGSWLGKYFNFIKSRFGEVVDFEEIISSHEQGSIYKGRKDRTILSTLPSKVNETLSENGLRLYVIERYKQVILTTEYDDGSLVLLPNRAEKIKKAFKGRKTSETVRSFCKDMMSVKVEGNSLTSILTKRELEVFIYTLHGKIHTDGNVRRLIMKKVIEMGHGGVIDIQKIGEEDGGTNRPIHSFMERWS